MSFKYFDDLWNQGNADLEKQKMHWDARAKEFNKYREQTGEERIRKLMEFFEQQKVSLKNLDILDIGCGAGQFSLEFAKQAKSVTGLDISTQMIEYANHNAQTEGITNVQFLELPWENIDVSAQGWHKKYDLAVAIMTPAVDSRQSLEKMMEASKGYCFMSGHLERFEKVKAEIEQNVLHKNVGKSTHGKGIYCSFNILWLNGIYPEISYHSMERENDRTVEEAFTYYCSQLEMKKALTVPEKEAIKEYLEKVAQNGRVKDTFRSKTAWLFWDNTTMEVVR